MHKMVVCKYKKKNLQNYSGMYKNGPDYEEKIYQTQKKNIKINENWVASLPTRRKDTKYKMFPLVSVQVWHEEPGNMHPYNFKA